MFGASATTPEDVGCVFIASPHILAIVAQKLAIMTCTCAELPLWPVALPRRGTAVKIHCTAAALKNSTGGFTENAITFYFELRFQWSWTFQKACFEAYTTLYSTSREYNHFNHLSLQCLHMPFLLNISSYEGCNHLFVSSLWAISPWACDLNHFNTYEFHSWL